MEARKGLGYIIVALLVTILALGCFSIYQYTKRNPKCVTTTTETTESTEKNENNEKNETVTQKTSDERYKEYLTNLSNNIRTKYGERVLEYDYLFERTGIMLNNNLELVVINADNQREKIADNVVLFRVIHFGGSLVTTDDGNLTDIFYVTTEGKVYMKSYIPGKTTTAQELDYKNVIDIRKGSLAEGGLEPIFVDIDYNVIPALDSGVMLYKKN